MRKLTIVTTCTERKSLTVEPRLQVRSLPAGSMASRADHWRTRLAEAVDRRPLTQLYQGEAWTQARILCQSATGAGYEPLLMVASAGVGLRPAEWQGPAYGATLTSGHEDSVARSRAEARQWWSCLAPDAAKELRSAAGMGAVLLVLSDPYASALDEDLRTLSQHGGDIMLVGGHRDVEGLSRVPTDARLRSALGGTLSSVNLRIAESWLRRISDGPLYTDARQRDWDLWAAQMRRDDPRGRTTLTDSQVRNFVLEVRQRDDALSCTRALRQLRDSGYACEQKRFSILFKSVVMPT